MRAPLLLLLTVAVLCAAPAFPQDDATDAEFMQTLKDANQSIKRMAEATRAQPVAPVSGPDIIKDIDAATKRGARALRSFQNWDGSWEGGIALRSVEKFYGRVAVTALAVEALSEQGRASDPEALKRGISFAMTGGLKKPDEIKEKAPKNEWTNVRPYALAFGLALAARRPDLKDKDGKPYAQLFVDAIRTAQEEGDLGYDSPAAPKEGEAAPSRGDPSSFQTALLVNALAKAKAPKVVLDALAGPLEEMRDGDGHFAYGTGWTNVDSKESIGRDVLCETALLRAGRAKPEAVKKAVDALLKSHAKMRAYFLKHPKEAPHTGPHQWADYFDLFSLYWASAALGELKAGGVEPEAGAREAASFLAGQVLTLEGKGKDKDGIWVDSRYGGPSYGTAAALLTLANLRPLLADSEVAAQAEKR